MMAAGWQTQMCVLTEGRAKRNIIEQILQCCKLCQPIQQRETKHRLLCRLPSSVPSHASEGTNNLCFPPRSPHPFQLQPQPLVSQGVTVPGSILLRCHRASLLPNHSAQVFLLVPVVMYRWWDLVPSSGRAYVTAASSWIGYRLFCRVLSILNTYLKVSMQLVTFKICTV